jgi:hypothetical protein
MPPLVSGSPETSKTPDTLRPGSFHRWVKLARDLLRRSVPHRNIGRVTYVEERPGKLVQVLVDDTWHDGTLEAWRKIDGRWRGYVRWSVGVGMRHLGWVDQEQLRP